jgi:UDP-glucuronate 4-epimerase
MTVLLTGAAGFIGMYVAQALIARGHTVVGIDNLNDYYDPRLKEARLQQIAATEGASERFTFVRGDITDRALLDRLFAEHAFGRVVHLAAQAGVQYSLKNPGSYIRANIDGFYEIIDCCRAYGVERLLFAGSSSVYGKNKEYPYRTTDRTDQPVSLYAATKKADELIAYAYAEAFGVRSVSMRFFTVYGPWGRPDMAPFIFTKAAFERKPIYLNNGGRMWRDFTYIDDIVSGVMALFDGEDTAETPLFRVYNIGNNRSVALGELVEAIEQASGRELEKISRPLPVGDVLRTYADIDPMRSEYGWEPHTALADGIPRFVAWYREFYGA